MARPVVLLALLLASSPAAADDAQSASEPAEAATEEVIEVVAVSENPAAERLDPTPSAYVLRGEELAAPGLDAASALARVPGVQLTRSGGSADLATVSVRGATAAQTPIYLAGVRLNDDVNGSVDLSTLPLWLLHRIEVYRGNAPVDADLLGIGGAVLLQPQIPQRTRAIGALGVGSFGEREARAALALADERAGALIAVRHRSARGDFAYLDDAGTRFDDSDDQQRTRLNAGHAELDVWTIGRLQRERTRLMTFVNVFERSAGAPGLSLLGARHSRSEQQRVIAGVDADVPCAADVDPMGRDICRVSIDLGALLSRYRLDDPRRELGVATATQTAGERYTQRLRLHARATDWLEASIGGSLSQQLLRLDIEGSATQRARRHLMRPELSLVAEPSDALAVVGVGAFECLSTAARGAADDGARETCGVLAPMGRLGLRWRLFDMLALTSNVGRYVRVPTLGELYGQSAVVRGNERLSEEGGYSVDVGLAFQGQFGVVDSWAQAGAFVRFADSLIGFRRSSLGVIRPYNIGRARVLGAELAAGVRLWRVVEVGATMTAMDPRDTSDERTVSNDLLPYHARLMASGRVAVSSPPWSALALDRAHIAARLSYRSSRVADPAGLIALAEQRQLDVEASLAFAERVRVSGRMANALDESNFDLVGYPLAGRSLHALLESYW